MLMNEFLPSGTFLTAFLAASFILAITPGPGVFYIVTRSLMQGKRCGLASVAGVAVGNLANGIGAALGLAALFAISSVAFSIVKYAGALYLIYLGVRTICSRPMKVPFANNEPQSLSHIFRDGFFVALLNPKTTVFFGAFLPQFMSPQASPVVQSVMLASIFVAIAAVTDTVYALTAGTVAPALTRARGIRLFGRYLTGSIFIGLGVFTALVGTRNK